MPLRRPADAPQMSHAELDALQREHLAYRAGLRREGLLFANGPLDGRRTSRCAGSRFFGCDIAEARRLSDADPSVRAGFLAHEVMEWWVAADSITFPNVDRPVGERRSTPDE